MRVLHVIPPGTPVTLAGGIVGGVIQVCVLANDHVQYQVAWWDGNTRHLQWLEEAEVVIAEGHQTRAIGFASIPAGE